jgi:hypothetical protein
MACDDLTPDSNLSDSCIFINDGPSAQWWMSPDINLNSFTDVAKTGQNNTVDVTVHRGPENDKCTALAAATNIIVEVWVSPGGLNLSPTAAKNIGTKVIPKSQLPANGQRSLAQAGNIVNWTPSTTSGAPDGPGHRCLIARCYPDTDGTPDPDCFHVRGDAHVAQRNIEIVTVSPLRNRGILIAEIMTVNPDPERPQPATVRVVTDPEPDRRVLQILEPGLRNTGVFSRVTSTSPKRIDLQFPTLTGVKTRDYTRRGCLPSIFGFGKRSYAPSFEADVVLTPGEPTSFKFEADLSSGRKGDAFIFYLTHLRADRQEIGGLTLVGVISD